VVQIVQIPLFYGKTSKLTAFFIKTKNVRADIIKVILWRWNMDAKKRAIKDVIGYIEAKMSLEERLDLETIANHAGYSRFHLNRIFSEMTGCTLHRYIKERRLSEAARKLVEEETHSISDIAFEASYQSQQAFTLAFKNAFGCTPKTYRENGICKELRRMEIISRQTEQRRCAA
jgi:AraC family transcriptional activator of mar-sox-rob regulon